MPTERIDIQVRERGTRTVRRRLESLGDVAVRSTRGLRLLQNALFVLGGAGVLRGLVAVADSLTSFENRLRIVTDTTAELNAVQAELFRLAQSTRAGFDSVAETYARTALSVRFLGLSQREVLNFTESLTQAAILSGASVRETNAALVQLGQGLASNRLSGDELRSVLEQLPFVADIIARQLDTTRGGLRALAKEGRVTTQVILDAFTGARDEIQEAFDTITPTIGQSLQVLYAGFQRLLDSFDDATGSSAAVARAIIAIGHNADIVAASVAAIAIAFTTIRIGQGIDVLVTRFQKARAAQIALTAAVDAGKATALDSISVERAKAGVAVQNAFAARRQTQATFEQIQAERALLAQRLADLQQARVRLSTTITEAGHRRTLAGHVVNQARAERILQRIQRETLRVQEALTASHVRLQAAMTARTAATNAYAAAETRATAAAAASLTLSAQLSRAFPTTALFLGQIRDSISALFGILRRNPLIAFITSIVVASVSILGIGDRFIIAGQEARNFSSTAIESVDDFENSIREAASSIDEFGESYIRTFEELGDFIDVASNEAVTLKDAFIAAFQLTSEFIQEELSVIGSGLSRIFDNVLGLFNTNLTEIQRAFSRFGDFFITVGARIVNITLGLFVGLIRGITRSFHLLPALVAEVGALTINALIREFEIGLTEIDRFLDITFPSLAEKLNLDEIDLSGLRAPVGETAELVNTIFTEEFQRALGTDYLGNIIQRARENIAGVRADLDRQGRARETREFENYLAQLERETALLGLNEEERQIGLTVLKAERVLKRKLLTDTEVPLIAAVVRSGLALKQRRNLLDDILAPTKDYADTLNNLNQLFSEGEITGAQYDFRLRELSGTFGTNVEALLRERDALRLVSREREAYQTILEIESDIGEVLSGDRREQIKNITAFNQSVKEQTSLYEQIIEPATAYARTLANLDYLAESGAISFRQHQFAVQELGGTFESSVSALDREAEAFRRSAEDREVYNAVLQAQRNILQILDPPQKAEIERLKRRNIHIREQEQSYQRIRGPLDAYNRGLRAVGRNLVEGRVSYQEFTHEVNRLRLAFLDTQRDAFSGFERGYLRLIQQTSDFASASESIITQAYSGISDALADLVIQGKTDFRALVDDIQRQLLRLAANQLFQFLVGQIGTNLLGGGTLITGTVGGGGGALPGNQQGGAFIVPGTGAPDSRIVNFRATPGERVSIETAAQQRRRNSGTVVNVHNYGSPEDAEVRTSTGPGGEEVIDIFVNRGLANGARTGSLDPVMRAYGARRQLINRG